MFSNKFTYLLCFVNRFSLSLRFISVILTLFLAAFRCSTTLRLRLSISTCQPCCWCNSSSSTILILLSILHLNDTTLMTSFISWKTAGGTPFFPYPCVCLLCIVEVLLRVYSWGPNTAFASIFSSSLSILSGCISLLLRTPSFKIDFSFELCQLAFPGFLRLYVR